MQWLPDDAFEHNNTEGYLLSHHLISPQHFKEYILALRALKRPYSVLSFSALHYTAYLAHGSWKHVVLNVLTDEEVETEVHGHLHFLLDMRVVAFLVLRLPFHFIWHGLLCRSYGGGSLSVGLETFQRQLTAAAELLQLNHTGASMQLNAQVSTGTGACFVTPGRR